MRILDGWTVPQEASDTREVRVSRGMSIAEGIAQLRPNSADRLLLERGGVWMAGLGNWRLSGRAPDARIVVAAYGDGPRPVLECADGLIGGGSNVAIIGIHFKGTGNGAGIKWTNPSRHVLIEDCKVEGYAQNVVFQGVDGRHLDIRVRRSVIVDAHATTGEHAQGLYAWAVDGLLIEECVFDANGYPADIYSHGLYIDNGNTAVTIKGCIIANSGSHGMQLRCGGLCLDNLFVRNAISLAVGGGDDPEPFGVTCGVGGNVILNGKDIATGLPRGWAIWLANIRNGSVEHNVMAYGAGGQSVAITLEGAHPKSHGIHGLSILGNIAYQWPGGVEVTGNAEELSGVAFTYNDIQGAAGITYKGSGRIMEAQNHWWANGRPYYPDTSLGVAAEALIPSARKQRRDLWRDDLTGTYQARRIRAGYRL